MQTNFQPHLKLLDHSSKSSANILIIFITMTLVLRLKCTNQAAVSLNQSLQFSFRIYAHI